MTDEDLIYETLKLAAKAESQNEVPIGAIITHQNKIIASAFNLVESETCVTKHAEIQVIEQASKVLKNWRLADCKLYVTLEPCPMCMTAIRLSRISKVVFGAFDPRLGACGSHVDLGKDLELGALPEVVGGVLKDDCLKILQDFFKRRRLESKAN